MHEPLKWKLAGGSPRGPSLWQSVLRFGLPFILLFHVIGYAISRMNRDRSTWLLHPWWLEIIGDVFLLFFVSAFWRRIVRESGTWKDKKRQG
jgi:hypothetical protein